MVCELNADPEIYALVISSDGPKFFSASADLKVFADGDKAMSAARTRTLRQPVRHRRPEGGRASLPGKTRCAVAQCVTLTTRRVRAP